MTIRTKPQAPNRLLAINGMMASTSCFALSGYFFVAATEELGKWTALWLRFAIPLALLGLVLKKIPWKDMVRARPPQLLRAFFLLASQALFFESASRGGLFMGLVLYNTGPLFLIAIDVALQKKRMSLLTPLSAVIGMAGVWLIYHNAELADPLTIGAGLLSGLCYALSQYTLFIATATTAKETVLAQTYFWCATVALLPLLFHIHHPNAIAPLAHGITLFHAMAAGVCSLGNQWFRALAYQNANKASELAPFLYVGVLLAAALDAVTERQLPSALTCVGGVCIAGAALLAGKGPAGRSAGRAAQPSSNRA